MAYHLLGLICSLATQCGFHTEYVWKRSQYMRCSMNFFLISNLWWKKICAIYSVRITIENHWMHISLGFQSTICV